MTRLRLQLLRTVLIAMTLATLVALPVTVSAAGRDEAALGRALQEVARLVQQHRFQEIVVLLEPFDAPGSVARNDPQGEYAVTAELGRAYYHLGRYTQAYEILRRAVALEPKRAETALYLQAAAYVTGRKEQAFGIFRQLLRSGARDLYLAVTLPGESAFLAEPEVWAILEEEARVLAVDLGQGTVAGVRLGDDRSEVGAAMGAAPGSPTGPVLAARAGPKEIWAFRFSTAGGLEEMVFEAESLVRYTPYRLSFGGTTGWRLTPAAAISLLGRPSATSTTDSGGLELSWTQPGRTLSLVFGVPASPRPLPIPAGTAMLLRLTIKR